MTDTDRNVRLEIGRGMSLVVPVPKKGSDPVLVAYQYLRQIDGSFVKLQVKVDDEGIVEVSA